MPIRRLLMPAGLTAFFVASALVALNLSTAGPGSDSRVTVTSHPAPNLTMTVTLDHGRLIRGRPLAVHVQLTNTGPVVVPLPGDGYCPFLVPLRLVLLDQSGLVVWSQPVPMIACAPVLEQPQPGRKANPLFPGASLQADACFALEQSGQCPVLSLADGVYLVAGTYYGLALPEAAFRISR